MKIEENSFDVLRLFSALQVMLMHFNGYYFKLNEGQVNTVTDVYRYCIRFFPGVVVLFALSGFLIAYSYEKNKNAKVFITKRMKRIYPSLWIQSIVNFIVIFILAREILDKSMIKWGITQFIGVAYTPNCLKNFATGSANGALWTVFTELQLYIVYLVIAKLLKEYKRNIAVIGIIFLIICNYVCYILSGRGYFTKIIERCFLPYAIWFFIGVVLYHERNTWLKWLSRQALGILVLYVICRFFAVNKVGGYYCDIVTSVLLPILTISIAYALGKHRLKFDISYHMFLYHWIVLNFLIATDIITKFTVMPMIMIYVGITLAVTVSMYTLEKRYIRLK